MYKINAEFIERYEGSDALSYFIEKNEFVRHGRMGREWNFRRFLEAGRSTWHARLMPDRTSIPQQPDMPCADHVRVFAQKRGGYRCIVSQPYVGKDELVETMLPWAERCGLEVDIYSSARSWYYPGGTSLYIVHLPGIKIVKPILVWSYVHGTGTLQ